MSGNVYFGFEIHKAKISSLNLLTHSLVFRSINRSDFNFYPFDFAKSFWNQMKINIENGNISILD